MMENTFEDTMRQILDSRHRTILVRGGSGTGKTEALSRKAAQCISRCRESGSVVLVSYDRSSTDVLCSKVAERCRQIGCDATFSGETAISFCWSLISRNPELFGVEGYKLRSSVYLGALIDIAEYRIRSEYGRSDIWPIYIYLQTHQCTLEEALASGYTPRTRSDESLLANLATKDTPALLEYIRVYSDLKRDLKVLDHYDSYLVFCETLENNPSLGRKVFEGVSHVFVDDISECDHLQMRFLSVVGRYCNLMMTGDPAMYVVHREAGEYVSLSKVPGLFPGVVTYDLERSFRLGKNSIYLLEWVFSKSKYPCQLPLPKDGECEALSIYTGSSDSDIRSRIGDIVQSYKDSGGSYSDILILGKNTFEVSDAQK